MAAANGIPSIGVEYVPYPSARTFILVLISRCNFKIILFMKYIKIWLGLFLTLVLFSCTKLDETFGSELEQNNSASITPGHLLQSAYNSLNGLFQPRQLSGMPQEISSMKQSRQPVDQTGMIMVYGGHYMHIPGMPIMIICQAHLTVYWVHNLQLRMYLQFNPSAQQAAEARFIRALINVRSIGWLGPGSLQGRSFQL